MVSLCVFFSVCHWAPDNKFLSVTNRCNNKNVPSLSDSRSLRESLWTYGLIKDKYTNQYLFPSENYTEKYCYILGLHWDDWYALPNFNPKSLEDLTVKYNAEIPTTNIANCKSNLKYGYCLFN